MLQLHILHLLLALGLELCHHSLVVLLELIYASLELARCLLLLLHQRLFLRGVRLFELNDLLFEVLNTLLHLHLHELLVAAGILSQLVQHALVLLLELLHLPPMLLGQARLHLIVLLLGLLLEGLELLLQLLQLFAQGFTCLVTTLHRLV